MPRNVQALQIGTCTIGCKRIGGVFVDMQRLVWLYIPQKKKWSYRQNPCWALFGTQKDPAHTSSAPQRCVLVVRVTSRFLPIWHLTIIHFSFYSLEIKLGRIASNRLVPNRCDSIASCLSGFLASCYHYHFVSAVRHDLFGVLRSFRDEQSFNLEMWRVLVMRKSE